MQIINKDTVVENEEATSDNHLLNHKDNFKIPGWGCRHQQSLILFFCLAISFGIRAFMGVALVAMTDITAVDNTEHITINSSLQADLNQTDRTMKNTEHVHADSKNITFQENGLLSALLLVPPYPKINWSKKEQDTILVAFFWGYMVLQIPGGQLAHRFGARLVLTASMATTCVLSFCLPWVAYHGGWILTVICRLLLGISQACVLPSTQSVFGKWAPLEERGRLAAIAYGGAPLGPVLVLSISGFLITSPLGWPGIFRLYGILSGLMAMILWCMLADAPSKHHKISPSERRYIEGALGQKDEDAKVPPVPWAHILRSRGVMALILAHTGHTWSYVILFSEGPTFLHIILKVNIETNGVLSALPYLAMWIANFFFSWFHDMLIVKRVLTVTQCRKLANSIGFVPEAMGFVLLGYVSRNIYVFETVLVVMCIFKVASHMGFHVNHIDLSPNFAGILWGISNFTAHALGSLAPLVADFILSDVNSLHQWKQVFFLTAGIIFFSNLLYVMLGTSEKADWNDLGYANNQNLNRRELKPMIVRDSTSEQL